MSAVIGGALCLASFLPRGRGGLLPMSRALQIGLVAIPLVWLLVKQGMAQSVLPPATGPGGRDRDTRGAKHPSVDHNGSSAVVFPVAALLLVAVRVRDHRKFLALRTEIRNLVPSRQASP